MAITYPLTPPSTQREVDLSITARNVIAVSESPFTLSQQVQAHPGEAWALALTLPPMERDDAEEWVAFLCALRGRLGTFLLGPYHGVSARGVATGTPLVAGGGQTGAELDTDGWTPSTAGILKKGDFIQLGTGADAHLHKLLEDADSDGAGASTLSIWPSLRTSPTDNAPVVVSSPVGLWRLTTNSVSWSVNVAQVFGLAIDAVEVL